MPRVTQGFGAGITAGTAGVNVRFNNDPQTRVRVTAGAADVYVLLNQVLTGAVDAMPATNPPGDSPFTAIPDAATAIAKAVKVPLGTTEYFECRPVSGQSGPGIHRMILLTAASTSVVTGGGTDVS